MSQICENCGSFHPSNYVCKCSKKEALKKDEGKLQYDLLDFDAVDGLVRVLTHGTVKYARDNWRSGFAWRRLLAAALRHLSSFARGEDFDPDSGYPHIDHLACCVMFLSAHQKQQLGQDDRLKTHLKVLDADELVEDDSPMETEIELTEVVSDATIKEMHEQHGRYSAAKDAVVKCASQLSAAYSLKQPVVDLFLDLEVLTALAAREGDKLRAML